MTLIAAFVTIAIALGACRSGAPGARDGEGADTSARARQRTSSIPGYTEFYRLMRYNAFGQIVLCYPTQDPKGEPDVFAVARDINGRPKTITRFFFGNHDTRSEWTTMQIAYTYYPSTAMLVERRTYHEGTGAPKQVRGAFGVEVLNKGGLLTMRRLIDKEGEPIVGVPIVVRSLFKEERPGTNIQEWFFGNGKQYRGQGTDDPGMPFGDMPQQAYFRRFTVSPRGEVVREEVWGLDKRAMPFPGGEIVRAYEQNHCGQTSQIAYLDEHGEVRSNDDGIVRETLQYDGSGRLVEWRAYGEGGSPHQRRSDSAAGLVFRYRDFDGVLVAIERYNAKGDTLAPLTSEAIGRRR